MATRRLGVYIDETTEQRYATVLTCSAHYAPDKVPGYLEELLQRNYKHLNNYETQAFLEQLVKYQAVFSKSKDDIGPTASVAAPILQPPRRQPVGKREVEEQEIQKMLEQKIIEPTNSP
ncbi:hypothetical protein CHS0354_019900 [Potamilus streckersoni]|uniref:Uncharacterized protein n=1 Tax=Potamilus streckersoni TaxID=2493646 RepID=A0AAE0VZJ0_9BIVA|nr:hypothetical protein CHS0354_019900 [Potamilus streckersoni]